MAEAITGKKIVIGVCGGIAAYKVVELARLLMGAGALVEVIMTKNATHFICPMTFEAVTNGKVYVDMFSQGHAPFEHIRLGQDSHLIIVAPATANMIAKIAHGIGDDLLSTTLLAATCPVLVCPSMNERMYLNKVVQRNLELIQGIGYHVMAPDSGPLACGTSGQGRLPEPRHIVDRVRHILTPKDMAGLKVLVTAGPTREFIDPVRFISNPSSGKMGYALAQAASERGAQVVLVSGPTNLEPPYGVKVFMVTSAVEMRDAVMENIEGVSLVIKAAAVSDFRPKVFSGQKIKKEMGPSPIELVENPDILAELGGLKGTRPLVLVGFAAESEEIIQNAKKKMQKKNLDMIVANDITHRASGFQADTNQVKILYKDGDVEHLPLLKKYELAHVILDRAKELLKGYRLVS